MIKIKRPKIAASRKTSLANGTADLWMQWRQNGAVPSAKSSVYAHPEVKKAFREAQNNKCAYCETVNPTSHEVIEHYRPKNGCKQNSSDPLLKPQYFWLAYDWNNFLFACDRCNDRGHKGNLFPLANPSARASAASTSHTREVPLLINPFTTNPEKHIEWNRDIPKPRHNSRKGAKTIALLRLDESSLLMDERRKYYQTTKHILEALETASPNNTIRRKLVPILKDKIKDDAPWSAMIRENFGTRIGAL